MPIIARCADGRCLMKHVLPDGDDEAVQLTGSVGEAGRNLDADVRNVQSRLNRVPQSAGGPLEALAVDGICGSRTKAAILRFQRHYPDLLLKDGRIDVNKSSWRKLLLVSDTSEPVFAAKVAPAVLAAGDGTDPATQALFARYLFLTQYRVYEAIKALDVAREEVQVCVAHCNLHPGTSFFEAYRHWWVKMVELPTVDRCFHILDAKVEATITLERIRRVRKVFADMVEVIVGNSFTTPAADLTGARRYLRVTRQTVLDNAHPDRGRNGVLADATLGGWWQKNANRASIRYGSHFVDRSDGLSTLIHEMAHFVSHASTYQIADAGGYYHQAFSASRDVALRTAECYSWYAMLASFKTLRDRPDYELPTDL